MKPTWTRRRPKATSASITRKRGRLGGHQRLLAEDRLAGGDARQKLLLVRGTPGADHHRLHPVRTDQRLRRVEDLGAFGRCGLGAVAVDVADRDDLDPGEHLGETADVILADHPRPDDADPEAHFAPQYLST